MGQLNRVKPKNGRRSKLFFAILTCIFIYGAYFYNLLREHYHLIAQKQKALESVKAIAVPGTGFLNNLGSTFILQSSLFYLILLGMIFLVFLLLSLLFRSPWKRAIFLSLKTPSYLS